MYNRKAPDLIFGVGRRRAGRSWVLARFSRSVGGIYYQATNRTESEQLAALSAIIGTHFNDAAFRQGVALPDWERLFRYLTDRHWRDQRRGARAYLARAHCAPS